MFSEILDFKERFLSSNKVFGENGFIYEDKYKLSEISLPDNIQAQFYIRLNSSPISVGNANKGKITPFVIPFSLVIQLNNKIDPLHAIEAAASQILGEECITIRNIDCDTGRIFSDELNVEEILIDKFSLIKFSLEAYIEKCYPCAKEICIGESC